MAGFDKYVKSLLHCNNNFLKIINDEVSSNIWQLRGQPIISKDNSRFNLAYQFRRGELNFLRLDRELNLGGTNDFTLDFWLFNKEDSSGRLFEFYNGEELSRITISIEDNKLKFLGRADEVYQSEYSLELPVNSLCHIAILCYSEISRLYFYLDGEKQETVIFKIPEGDYSFVIGNETDSSNLSLSISEIRMSRERRWMSNFQSKLENEFISDYRDIFFLKFKDSLVDSSELSSGFAVEFGYHEITDLNSPFGKSLYLDGNSRLKSNELIKLGSKDFCIDGWVSIENKSDNSISSIFEFGDNLKLVFNNSNSSLSLYLDGESSIVSGIWNNRLFHFALVFKLSDSFSLNLYLNGQRVLKRENISRFNKEISNYFIYGNNLKCYLSELRISSGIARFIGNFILPKLPYTEDTFCKSTEVLLHLNQTSLKDERGNNWSLVDDSIHFIKDGARFSNAIELYKDKQYLYLPELLLGYSDFTLEFWTMTKDYYRDTSGVIFYLINKNSTQMMNLSVIRENFYRLLIVLNSEISYQWEFTADFNKLYHIAVTYSSNLKIVKMFLNGRQLKYIDNLFELQLEDRFIPDNFRVYLGSDLLGKDFYMGTLNEFRISNILRYSESFIPNNKEFVPDKHTLSLLHLNSSAIQDLIGNEWKLIQGILERSLLTDNSIFDRALILKKNQYLKMNDPLYLGGQDFTIDIYARIDSSTSSNGGLFEFYNLEDDSFIRLQRYKDSQGINLSIGIEGNYYRNQDVVCTDINLLNSFHHFAIVYNYSTKIISLYIDGIKKGSINDYTIERQTFNFNVLGKSYFNKLGYFEGILDEFRVVDGIALWNKDTFKLPTRESSFISNIDKYTKVLLHFDESANRDESGRLWIKEGLSTGVRLSPLSYKFPYSSAYFDGSSCLRFMNKLELGNSDFLINFYISLEKLSSGSITKLFQFYNSQFTLENSIQCYIDNESRRVYVTINYSDKLVSETSIDFNQFYRISILYKKDLNTFVLYIDNREEDFIYYSLKSTIYSNVVIGHSGSDNSQYLWYNSFFTGYIDDFRVLLNVLDFMDDSDKLYLEDDKPFINDSHTKSLLQFKDYKVKDTYKEGNWNDTWNFKGDSITLHLDESFLDSFVTNTWEIEGSPVIKSCPVSLFSDESVSYAYYNNGEDFYYLYNNQVNLEEIFNNDFTLDFWVYFDSTAHNQGLISSNMSEYYWEGFVVLCANGYLRFSAKFNNTWRDLTFFKLTENEWIHVALVRQGNKLSGYKNGKFMESYEIGDFQGIEHQLNLGYWYRTGTGYGGLLNGYLREVRITKSVIWTEQKFKLSSSKNDNFYLITDNPIKNSFTLFKDQYLEKDLSVILPEDFTIEAYVSLNVSQTFFSLIGGTGRTQTDELTIITESTIRIIETMTIKAIETCKLLLTINDNSYEIAIDDISEKIHHIAVTYARNKSQTKVFIDSQLIETIDQIELTDSEFRIYLGRDLEGNSEGIKLINEFRISSIVRNCYNLLNQEESSNQVSEYDLILLRFKDRLLKDEVSGNFWRVEGEKNLLPEIKDGEDYFSYSRFGNCLYLAKYTYLRLSDSGGFFLGGKDFSIESWVFNQSNSILFSAKTLNRREGRTTTDELTIKLRLEGVIVQINDLELRLEENLRDLYHIALEYQYIEKKLVLYINGEERVSLRDLNIPEIEFDEVYIGFDGRRSYSDMYLDEFRISNGIARWRGNFLLEIQPYSFLMYPKKLAVRNRESGTVEYISLYYDIPERGYSVYDKDSNIVVYAELSELEDRELYSNLISRIDNKEYILPRESVKLLKGFNYFYRLNKITGKLEYSSDGIEEYIPIESLLINLDKLLEFEPVLIIKENDLEDLEELSDYINIYRKFEETDDFVYYQYSYISLDSTYELYLSYREISKNRFDVIISEIQTEEDIPNFLQVFMLLRS